MKINHNIYLSNIIIKNGIKINIYLLIRILKI